MATHTSILAWRIPWSEEYFACFTIFYSDFITVGSELLTVIKKKNAANIATFSTNYVIGKWHKQNYIVAG